MFKQFTQNINGQQVYLLSSLGIFFVFFIVVTIILYRLGKTHVDHMSRLPLSENNIDPSKNLL
jgi:cbb3-type cytochrome oxidase subunit 3